ncbi:Carotenoid isomerooxygenase [Chionoecetes opilio]|uniref:Carotenoid isomerooxygenase n=1 Tax=Chionoecetes opilio TaxID=41210 RepID=A0A8J4YH84_CHIOP|nr:Carotenoid isomerooxygenase [Chionoecetes opilio]
MAAEHRTLTPLGRRRAGSEATLERVWHQALALAPQDTSHVPQVTTSTEVKGGGNTYDYSVLCRHCDKESCEPLPCQLTGTLPEWLNGKLIYNGPGLTKVGKQEYNHAFDSAGLLQKFDITGGKVTYSNRYVRSKTFEQNQAAEAITKAEFGTPGPSSKGMFSRLLDAMDPEKMFSDNALVTVADFGGGRYFAMCETPFVLEINPDTLEIKERVNLNKKYGLMTQTPHPILASDGLYTVGQGVGVTGPKYCIVKFPPDGNLKQGKVVASVPARWKMSPAYMHSMTMTENYVVLIEQPLSVSLTEMLSDIVTNAPFISGLKWHNEQVLIHVIDRKTWKPVKTRYVTDPFFFMHVANAYEDGEHIVLDVPTYKDSSLLHHMYIKTLREQRGKNTEEFVSSFRSTLHRLVVPLNAKGKETLVTLQGTTCTAAWSGQEVVLKTEKLCEVPFENPCINPAHRGGKYSFLWAMGPDPEGGDKGFAIKLNVHSGESHNFTEDQLYCSSPEFVARPGSESEDDGLILFLGIDSQNDKRVSLVVLDAATMTEVGRASVVTPAPVPMPLHGLYIPAPAPPQ